MIIVIGDIILIRLAFKHFDFNSGTERRLMKNVF